MSIATKEEIFGTPARSLETVMAAAGDHPRGRTILPTGFYPLDESLGGGLRSGTLTLLGGVPGVGKTIAAMQWARNMAQTGYNVVYSCYEHDEATLLGRLLLGELGDLVATENGNSNDAMRRSIWGIATGSIELGEAAAGNLMVRAAHARLGSYADHMWLHVSSPIQTDVESLESMLPPGGSGTTVLFVDYLQKVPGPPGHNAVGLKDMAIEYDIAVVAVVAGGVPGLEGRRFRLQHLDAAAELSYEADMVLVLNDKYEAVSKRHTAYDQVRAESYRQDVVFSIEKNREGPTGINLGFRKDFVHYRFHKEGEHIAEKLVDEVLYLE